ncbi:hypothetical protein KTF36_17865 [Burkholderia gladioli]|uniref:hypothetical protein n=1 Tax=Burkholderia gladioli TaxID=28095 RepID=UPI001C250110|nr:hypothetical protein [Burkholderia gladioli]MBU9643719.1 hypothetical protein [Burkholderia gladioli]
MKKVRRMCRVCRFKAVRVDFKPSYRHRTARTYALLKRAVERLTIVRTSDSDAMNQEKA